MSHSGRKLRNSSLSRGIRCPLVFEIRYPTLLWRAGLSLPICIAMKNEARYNV